MWRSPIVVLYRLSPTVSKDAGSKYSKTQLRTSVHWKAGFKSFPTVYDMPILSNIGVSYTVGKLLTSTFHPKYSILHTSSVLSPGVLGTFPCDNRASFTLLYSQDPPPPANPRTIPYRKRIPFVHLQFPCTLPLLYGPVCPSVHVSLQESTFVHHLNAYETELLWLTDL